MDKLLTFRYKETLFSLRLTWISRINYAFVLNEGRSFEKFEISGRGNAALRDLMVTISGEMLETCHLSLELMRPGARVNFPDARLMPVASKLMALTEAVQTTFRVTVSVEGETILAENLPLTLMAFDQWLGPDTKPELLASFVTPNYPKIREICSRASDILKTEIGDGSLVEYLTQDYGRIVSQIKAVYEALLQENITYVSAPAGFEGVGQRLRLADKVLNEKQGTCIDLSLLLCSCLESIGIRTMMVVVEGHAFMGAWAWPHADFPVVGFSADQLTPYISTGDRSLYLIEATGLTNGMTFDEAVMKAEACLDSIYTTFNCFVDIYSARKNRIRPLPHSVQSENGWEISEMPDYDKLFDEIGKRNPYDIQGTAIPEKLNDKRQVWERKLLDLSLRNSLLNMRPGKNVVPIAPMPVPEVLTMLDNGELYGAAAPDAKPEAKFDSMKSLWRAAKVAIEENGANSLFLSIGTMRWYDADRSRPFFAPVFFIPVELVRHGARQFAINRRDEECIVNVTLVEMMRQAFDLQIPSLYPVPEDDDGNADWQRVFGILRSVIADLNKSRPETAQWELVDECVIGLFSFTKFVMWNDMHAHPEVLAAQPLVASMAEGMSHFGKDGAETDARELDRTMRPADVCVPTDVDSSQLEAVVESGRGKSFVLHGPPGTGKSQTITNMIANALYQGKRVLFVSQKKAALDVVQSRLDSIGLDPFCLELHSNKVTKTSFLAQLESALAVAVSGNTTGDYAGKSDRLMERRRELNGFVEALHRRCRSGLSLYDYINRYLDIDGAAMPLCFKDVENIGEDAVQALCRKFRDMDLVQTIIGSHPSSHPLLGLYPRENTAENQRLVTECIQAMPEAIEKALQKESGLWNRWFAKKTAVEILHRGKEWQALTAVADIDGEIATDINRIWDKVRVWEESIDRLRHWYHYSTAVGAIKEAGLPKAMAYYLEGHSGEETASALLKGYYKANAVDVIDNDPVMRQFNVVLFEDLIEKYKTLAHEFQELSAAHLLEVLCRRASAIGFESKEQQNQVALLRKFIKNHGRCNSVRRIFERLSDILPELCPCMLMSPLSVSQFLAMRPGQFDLVIFDEASQMPTSEAVGVIARGNAVVVVGDPMQMPPTSFFTAGTSNDDEAETDDLESVLDDCIAVGIPSRYLSWHYRSRHESLIAFSNAHFYDGRLTTFPSVDDQDVKVSLQHVDGYYDFAKSRSNKFEAKAIVDEVVRLLRAQLGMGESGADSQAGVAERIPEAPVVLPSPKRSIGIVAFSKVQSALIEDMLADELAKQPELEKLAYGSDEPVFVKNLENVQGDERDIILFSVGYGPDKRGKVSMNFGPLNQTGGERRLNVAVTRARYSMKVFSTLRPDQIDLQRTGARGVEALKRFLEYAESGVLPRQAQQMTCEKVDTICEKIAAQLREKGFDVHENIGRSMFRIDLAVVDDKCPSRYRLGIIIDGGRYWSTPSARDREIVQPAVLSRLGWKLARVYTVDYMENPAACIARLVRACG